MIGGIRSLFCSSIRTYAKSSQSRVPNRRVFLHVKNGGRYKPFSITGLTSLEIYHRKAAEGSYKAISTKGLTSRQLFKRKFVQPDNQRALKRWIPLPNGNFIRKKSAVCPKHGKHTRAWKKRKNRHLILANPTQKRLLKKLIPNYKHVRRSYGGVDVWKEYKNLVCNKS